MSDHLLFSLFAGFFGMLWGSFANVVIARLPKKESVVFPRSHCPKCKTPIPWYLNIPVFSWLALRGRCAHCKTRISIRYPTVELLMGVVFFLIFYKYEMTFSTLEYFLFAFGLITASFIDFDHMILPDEFTLSGIIIGLLGAWINPDRSFMDAFLGFLLGGGLLLSIAYFYFAVRKIEGMGGGDIKLLGWIGAVCGLQSVVFVIFASSFLGLVFGGAYLLISRKGMKTGIPFGPYLSAAALIYILFDGDYLLSFLFPHLSY